MSDDPFDFEKLQMPVPEVPSEYTVKLRAARRARRSQHFALVPWVWIEQLFKARHAATLKLALHLLFQSWRTAGRPVVLSNVLTAGLFCRRTKKEAVDELEQLGLILVDRRDRASPVISLLHTHQQKRGSNG